ncbi:MAG: transcriptional repressor [Firmicutes bacterium]|nr:transcriptional repressor [Bacillota bacterium]MCL2256551.1 transcriptional repressor [Bacillota bacterium]
MKRNTIQKQLILSAVKSLNIHATAEEVYEHVVKDNPSISKATVYRNLSQMAKDGELLNIGNFSGSAHYDHNLHEHHHFVCNKCGAVFDVDCDLAMLEQLKKTIPHSNDFEIKNYNLSFDGVCSKCK